MGPQPARKPLRNAVFYARTVLRAGVSDGSNSGKTQGAVPY
ncbi:putative phage protein [Escherichia coli 2-052-05_S3_C3]|nr:putative phage protein [Escherichia coli 2-052-05_S3_C3]